MPTTQTISKRKTWTGLAIILVIAGVSLILSNVSLFLPRGLGHLIRTYWPCVILGIGISKLLPEMDRRRVEGYVYLAIGSFFQLLMLDWVPGGFASMWPVASIMFGLWIYFGGTSSDDRTDRSAISANDFELDELFSSRNVTVTSPDVLRGKVTLTLATLTMHFSDPEAARAECTVFIDSWFSSYTLRVPREWQVEMQATRLVSGVKDKRTGISAKPVPAGRILLLGALHFSRIEIKSPRPPVRPKKPARSSRTNAKDSPSPPGEL